MKSFNWLLSLFYFLSHLVVLNAALLSGLYLFQVEKFQENQGLNLVTINAMWILCGSIHKMYSLQLRSSFIMRFKNNVKGHLSFIILVSIVYLNFGFPDYLRRVMLYLVVVFPIINLFVEFLLFKFMGSLRVTGLNVKRVIIAGASKAGIKVYHHFQDNPDFGYEIIGFLDDNPAQTLYPTRVIGSLSSLDKLLEAGQADEIMIAISTQHKTEIQKLMDTADYFGVRIVLIPNYYDLIGNDYKMTQFGDTPVINVREVSLDRIYFAAFKRAFDIVFSALVLITLTPLFVILAATIKMESEGAVFYCPVRIGRNGKKFRVFKFRSMYTGESAVNGTNSTRRNDPRVTPFGRIMRKYSLDELPQFLNVLQGTMSVVGPRPHRVFLSEVMQKEVNQYMLRHYLKPGISGWAQVNGWRGPTDTEEQRNQRTMHDLWYMKNWSPALDFKIVYLTLFREEKMETAF